MVLAAKGKAGMQGGQQQAASSAQMFGLQQPQPAQANPDSEFHRMLQRAGRPQQHHNQLHQQAPSQIESQPPVISQADQPVPKPQPASKAPHPSADAAATRHAPQVPQLQDPEAIPASKRKSAAPKKAAPGPPSPQQPGPPAPAPAPAPTPAWSLPPQAPLSLSGVQHEQQQQQLQQQQEVSDWGAPSEPPASPKRTEPKAPWGAAKSPGLGQPTRAVLYCS